MADLKDWMSLSKPDPEWEQFVQSIGGKAPDIGTVPDIPSLRNWIDGVKAAMGAQASDKIPGVLETDHQVSMRDGARIICRTYQPESPPAGGSPLMVTYHGGGWCIGELQGEESLCRSVSSKLGVTCVNVDYRLAPENMFPIGVNDAFDATKWAVENASSLGANPLKGFIVSGTSAGANLATVVAHLWRDEGLQPPITGAHLAIPAVCHHAYMPENLKADHKSYEQNKNAAVLSDKAYNLFVSNYLNDEKEGESPLFSPLLFKTGRKGLPPTSFQVCGMDPLRDEGLIFERLLREQEGIKTKLEVYPGLPHGFASIAPHLSASKKFVEDSFKGVEWLL